MKPLPIYVFFKEQWQLMRKMPPKKRLEHIWEYYRFYLLGFLALVVLLGFVIQGQVRKHQEVLVSGIFINTDTSDEGYSFLSHDYWHLHGSDQNKRVDLIETVIIDFSDISNSQDSGNMILQVDALIAAKELDYMILNEEAFQFYTSRGLCMDLSSILDPTQMATLEERLVFADSPEQEMSVCFGLNLTDSVFSSKFGLTAEPSYFVVLSNAPHMSQLSDYLQYLFLS